MQVFYTDSNSNDLTIYTIQNFVWTWQSKVFTKIRDSKEGYRNSLAHVFTLSDYASRY